MFIAFRSIVTISIILLTSTLIVGCNKADDQAETSKPAPVRPVKTVVVKAITSSFKRTYSAVVLPSQEADLSFRVSGRIIQLPIRDGMKVKKGDVIAQLDLRDFKANIILIDSQLAQAREKLEELKAGDRKEDIASAEADVAAAEAQLDAAKSQAIRTETLFKKGIVTKTQLDKDVTTQRVAQATLKAKQQALIKGQVGARKEDLAAQAAVINGVLSQLETAKDNLSDATLRAPFDGIIATRKVDNFSNIQAKDAVAILQNIKTLDATFDVPAPDVARLAKIKNLDLQFTLESIPDRTFKARHKEFSTQADAATQTYQGRITIEDLEGETVLPGMTGNLIITAKRNGSIYKLPVAAIASDSSGNPFIWIVDPASKKTSKRELVTGEVSGGDIIVSKGLKQGDIVVTAGISALQDGMVVKPVTVIGE